LVSEAKAAAEIGHPTVVEVYDVGISDGGLAYLVTEPLRGETLPTSSHARVRSKPRTRVM